MILDSFKLDNVIVQLRYAEAFELWDRAGKISRQLCDIWPDLKLVEAGPQQQVLKGPGVEIQMGLAQSTVVLVGAKALEHRKVEQIKQTFEVWRQDLTLSRVDRVSMRVTYAKEFPSLGEANTELIGLNLAKWPTVKVFDQPMESDRNSVEILYRFEDENSFSVLRLKTEQIKYEVNLDPAFVEHPEIRKSKSRMIVDFDRGLLGSVSADKFRMDEWIKGYQHILRRDIEKVTKGSA